MKTKKLILTGTAIASVLALSVGITWAAFSAKTTTLNVVTMGNVHIDLIDEYTRPEGGVGPGDKIAKIVSARNTGKNTEWVRISVDKAWWDPKTDKELDRSVYDPSYIVLNTDDSLWVQSTDGYYYYQKPLLPGDRAEKNLMDSFELPADWDMEGYTNLEGHITVQAEAIQYDNFYPERNSEDKIIGWHGQTVQEALPEVTYSFTNSTDDSNVTFQYGTHEFVVLPDSTDLFGNFKGVMPGDSREQSVIISNKNDDKVKIWVYAVPADISCFESVADKTAEEQKFQSDDLLSKLELTVTKDSGVETESNELYSGKLISQYDPDPINPVNAKYLGEYAKGDTSTLTLTLKVPEELDNDYDDAIAKIQWVFVASNDEESSEPSEPSEEPSEPSEEPSEPSEEPSEPSKEPSEPSQPSEPSVPSVPSVPSKPIEPSEPSNSGTGGSIDVSTPNGSGGNNPAPNEPLAPPVQTGQDANEYIVPIIIVLVSLVTVVVLLLTTRKKKRDDDNT